LPIDVRHPAPADLQARWRATGAWTDETLLDRLVAAPGDALALVDGPRRRSLARLRDDVERIAGSLWARGVRPGDVVAWQLPNWAEAVALCWAVWRCGAVASPITPSLRGREVGFVLEQTAARVIVVPASFRGTDYPALVRDTGFTGNIVTSRAGGPPGGDAPGAPAPDVGVAADDPAVVLWTSGTTSEPKGVIHTHQSLRCEADGIAAAHAITAGEVLLLPMPVTHVAGLTYGVLLPVTHGVTAVLMDTWDAGEGLRLLSVERVNVMISTPVFMRSMIDHADFATTDTSALRLFSLGGAGVAPSMIREGARSFGGPDGCWCKRTYGSTEYPTLSTGRAGDDPERDATTDGTLIGPAEVRVVDPATGADVAGDGPGELWARGPEMFCGYLDRALDRDAFADGAWFRTGDLATFDGEHLTIVDRLKDVIIRGGENISAAEVEALLATHPAVVEAACVARPDPVMGERVCAYVIARDVVPAPTLEELRDHLLACGLARFKLPETLEVRAALPRTASGKVQKARLRAEQGDVAP
jgi:cyclohexanecarboxylate-CoA ligase